MIKNLEIITLSESQIEYIINNFSKTSCRQIANYLNNKLGRKSMRILPSRVFSIARLARISADKKLSYLNTDENKDEYERIHLKLEQLLPKKKLGVN